jgi:hypothetical protein
MVKRWFGTDARKIKGILRCTEEEATLVESVMRDMHGILGSLTLARYTASARKAKKLLDTDPELRRLKEEGH